MFGRLENLFVAFSIWAFKMATPMVISIGVSAVPIRVPATPSLEVKRAATIAVMPEANTVLIWTSCFGFSSSTITRPIVAMGYRALKAHLKDLAKGEGGRTLDTRWGLGEGDSPLLVDGDSVREA
ncbi:MAG: hypothetical protein CYG60_16425 [Actinobacteria bacterium]|nr:MAG: hypothetical protein CYG60_16425 [Actinomycetota bacterium]